MPQKQKSIKSSQEIDAQVDTFTFKKEETWIATCTRCLRRILAGENIFPISSKGNYCQNCYDVALALSILGANCKSGECD